MYDFRKEFLFYGPVSDLVPSTSVLGILYPFGFMTIAAQLHKDGFRVRILNLASMMLNDRDLDVEALLSKLRADVFGIDLHWLPHAQGSLAIPRSSSGSIPARRFCSVVTHPPITRRS